MGISLEDTKQSIPAPRNIQNIDMETATFKDDGDSFISMVE